MTRPPAVYLLQCRLRDDTRVLVLELDDLIALARHLATPDEFPRPDSLQAHWEGHPSGRRYAYPSYDLLAPILPVLAADVLRDELTGSGSLVPLETADDGPVEHGAYELFVAENLVDCLDVEASSDPENRDGYRRTVAFHADRLPDTLAFRVPQIPTLTYWTRTGADRVVDLVGDDVEPVVVWSQDPDLPVHPNPMGTRL